MQSVLDTVMPVLVTGIHALRPHRKAWMGRNKSGHDGIECGFAGRMACISPKLRRRSQRAGSAVSQSA